MMSVKTSWRWPAICLGEYSVMSSIYIVNDFNSKRLEHFKYCGELCFVSLRKQGKRNLRKVRLDKLPLHHALTKEMKSDVDKRLKTMFGDDWRTSD